MKNIIVMIMLMIGLLVNMASGSQITASSHPELVSGTSELVSGTSELATVSYPETTISATASSTIEASVGDPVPVEKGNFFTRNWGALVMGLLGFADLVTRLTPTEKDNSIINLLSTIINVLISNLKKGGGSFKLESK